jgi:hypothetical protein
LRDAQLTAAREYGVASWGELMEKVATELVEGRELHRYFGVELNNETWDLLVRAHPLAEPGAGGCRRRTP